MNHHAPPKDDAIVKVPEEGVSMHIIAVDRVCLIILVLCTQMSNNVPNDYFNTCYYIKFH